jgi:DNA-binding transcriptional regulator LsrR (DeoR family)
MIMLITHRHHKTIIKGDPLERGKMINSYSILPSDIRYSQKISAQAKILWLEISAYNYANIFEIRNSTLAKDLELSEVQISRLLNQLKKKSYLLIYKSSLNIRRLAAIGCTKLEKNAAQGKKNTSKDQKSHKINPLLEQFLKD